MSEKTLTERIAFEIMQRETSAEIEEIVFAGLKPYCDRFAADDHSERTMMMARAALHARDTAIRLRKEADDLSEMSALVRFDDARKAVLRDIKNPTESMLDAVSATGKMWRDLSSREVWQAMIDQAIKEGE